MKKIHFLLRSLHVVINCFVKPFPNETNLSKFFCSLRSGFQRICDASKFFLVSTFFGALEILQQMQDSGRCCSEGVSMVLNF